MLNTIGIEGIIGEIEFSKIRNPYKESLVILGTVILTTSKLCETILPTLLSDTRKKSLV